MKSNILIILGLITLGLVIVYLILSQNQLQNQIMSYIDENTYSDEPCIVEMNEVTKFEWDNMIIYQVGSSSSEISEILKVDFNDSVDLKSGIIFVKGNKIVYKESVAYNPEKPSKLLYYVGRLFDEEKYGVFTPDNAIFEGVKTKYGDEILYQLMPFNESESD